MYALNDGNNYVPCERVVQPRLGQRSNEGEDRGVKMARPWFRYDTLEMAGLIAVSASHVRTLLTTAVIGAAEHISGKNPAVKTRKVCRMLQRANQGAR